MAAPKIISDQSEYNQQAFIGGMNLLADDTRLQPNQYRIGFNLRNRYDKLDLIPSSSIDASAPIGLKQELITFGDFLILFVSGKAYYKYYKDINWIPVKGFQMDPYAPRLWTVSVPVSTTNYLRIAAATNSIQGAVLVNNIAGASSGNLPGLLVQDNINQPQFIFIGNDGFPTTRITQRYDQWKITFSDAGGTTVTDPSDDKREYVPIGNCMAWVNGILYVASPDSNFILRSVEGRPLDFVVNVKNSLDAGGPPYVQTPGGDAYTTAYSVGVGGITCLRPMAGNSLFVSASNSNFAVSLNTTQNAPLVFGQYTFIRNFLFNANCLSDRAIFDSTGDTRFIDLTGIRSFNAVSQNTNEGRNLPFTASIKGAFSTVNSAGSVVSSIVQDPNYSSGILFDDYELYACDSIFGPVIAVYDTINSCWVGFDISQTNGQRIKKLAKIELDIQALYAITEDDKLYKLYNGPLVDKALFRTIGLCANIIWAGNNVKYANPKYELHPRVMRVILNNITSDCDIELSAYVNNRLSTTDSKTIRFESPTTPTTNKLALADVDTQLENLYWNLANTVHGWKVFAVLSWTGGSVTQFSAEFADVTPMSSLNSR